MPRKSRPATKAAMSLNRCVPWKGMRVDCASAGCLQKGRSHCARPSQSARGPIPARRVSAESRMGNDMGTFTLTKTKQSLAAKTKAAKVKNKHAVSMASLVATAPADILGKMKLERRSISSLKGLKRRVRLSERDQIERVARSITRFRQAAPILIEHSGEILNGHVVVEALKTLGENEVWCAVIEHLDENERALLHVALNRLGETGGFDFDALGELCIEFESLGFDLSLTGFSMPELDIIMSPPTGKNDGEDEEGPIELPVDPASILGDLWVLGDHRLVCGDATDPSAYEAVLAGKRADVVFTDCPWNIPIENFVSGQGKIKHLNFVQGAGEMSEGQFVDFCETFHALGAGCLTDGGVFFSCIDWRSVDIVMKAGKSTGLRHINTAVWSKGCGSMGSPYRSAHEFVAVFVKGKKIAVNNIELGKHGRDRTTVWNYPGANRRGSSANDALALHPTAKPIELVRDALLDVSQRGSLVLDMFMGSGTTIMAAESSGRRACGIELDPHYVDVIIERWERATGEQAVHAETGLGLAELRDLRASQGGAYEAV